MRWWPIRRRRLPPPPPPDEMLVTEDRLRRNVEDVLAVRDRQIHGGIVVFLAGAPFAFTLLAILGVHELGHYFTARHYHASVSLPYFIPAPFLFGTLGAIILMRSPARDRNSLFDIAAAGPLAGLAVALPAG